MTCSGSTQHRAVTHVLRSLLPVHTPELDRLSLGALTLDESAAAETVVSMPPEILEHILGQLDSWFDVLGACGICRAARSAAVAMACSAGHRLDPLITFSHRHGDRQEQGSYELHVVGLFDEEAEPVPALLESLGETMAHRLCAALEGSAGGEQRPCLGVQGAMAAIDRAYECVDMNHLAEPYAAEYLEIREKIRDAVSLWLLRMGLRAVSVCHRHEVYFDDSELFAAFLDGHKRAENEAVAFLIAGDDVSGYRFVSLHVGETVDADLDAIRYYAVYGGGLE